jgi:hypothetical protein
MDLMRDMARLRLRMCDVVWDMIRGIRRKLSGFHMTMSKLHTTGSQRMEERVRG